MRTYTEAQSLTAREQYRMELAAMQTATVDQTTIEQARTGNQQARQHIIEDCLRYVVKVACNEASKAGIDALEVIAAGNLALVEYLAKALQAPNPPAHLRLAAKGIILNYCKEHRSIIRVPHSSYAEGKRAPQVMSLDQPLFTDEDVTLLELITA